MFFIDNSIIMAGGLGTRFSPYKVIYNICGKPMIKWVFDTLIGISRKVYIALSRDRVVNKYILNLFPKDNIIYTSGKGYENDIVEAIKLIGTPVLVVPADVPFISKSLILKLILECDKSICTLLCKNGYLGISVWRDLNFNEYKDIIVNEELLNINTLEDYIKANNICKQFIS
ncbi:MAG: NTP transferase domain-containing protein [Sulfolobaceae archaeon]